MRRGKVVRSLLGISAQNRPVDPRMRRALALLVESGVEVIRLEPQGPAALAGLYPGDIIVAIDGDAGTTVDGVQRVMRDWQVGTMLRVDLLRGAKCVERVLFPAEAPQ